MNTTGHPSFFDIENARQYPGMPAWRNQINLSREELPESTTIYRQPSFFTIEQKREELKTRSKIPHFPFALDAILEEGAKEHEIFSKTKETLEPADIEQIRLLTFCKDTTEIAQILNRIGSCKGTTFDAHDHLAHHRFQHESAWGGGGPVNRRSSELEMGHILGVCKSHTDKFAARIQSITLKQPWLIKFSEKYMNLFGVSFVGNGNRCIEGYEGLTLYHTYDTAKRDYGSSHQRKLSFPEERKFIESINDIIPVGKILRPSDEQHLDFNGCGQYLDGFEFILDNHSISFAYLDRSFGSYNREGWLFIFHNQTAQTMQGYAEQSRKEVAKPAQKATWSYTSPTP